MAKTEPATEPKRKKRSIDERIAELAQKREVELCGASMAEVRVYLKAGHFESARDYAHDLLERLERLCGEKANGQPGE